MSLGQLDLEGLTKVEFSMAIIRENEPEDDYYLAFSGGKESVVLLDLTKRVKARHTAHYHSSPIDPPPLIKFIKDEYPEVVFERPVVNFWKAFHKKGFPLRTKRWCCEYIKEWGGANGVVLTGLRSAESIRRRKRQMVELKPRGTRFSKAPRLMIHPIILWQESDVWEYIYTYKVKYCPLYDEGFKRLGCVMCPLASPENRLREYLRFPKTGRSWLHAFVRLYNANKEKYNSRWDSGEEMFNWWLSAT